MREQYKLRDIIRCTKARIKQGRLPTLRDVDNIRTSRLLEEVRQTVEAGTPERWLALVEDFLAERFPEGGVTGREMAAALLKLLMQRDFGNQDASREPDVFAEPAPGVPAPDGGPSRDARGGDSSNPRGRKNSAPMTKLRSVWGYAQGFPTRAGGRLAGESGISSRDIGAIGIRQQYAWWKWPRQVPSMCWRCSITACSSAGRG